MGSIQDARRTIIRKPEPPAQNTTAPAEQEPQVRYRSPTVLGFNPLQTSQMLADTIAAAPATGTRQGQLLRAQTVYRSFHPTPPPQMPTRAASTTTREVKLIRSRLNWDLIDSKTSIYFHHGLNQWRPFPSGETTEEDDKDRKSKAEDSTDPYRKREKPKKLFTFKSQGRKGDNEKKDPTISAPITGSLRYNER